MTIFLLWWQRVSTSDLSAGSLCAVQRSGAEPGGAESAARCLAPNPDHGRERAGDPATHCLLHRGHKVTSGPGRSLDGSLDSSIRERRRCRLFFAREGEQVHGTSRDEQRQNGEVLRRESHRGVVGSEAQAVKSSVSSLSLSGQTLW